MTKRTLAKPRGTVAGVSAALVNRICQRIAAGETLTAICREAGMPPCSTVRARINQSSSLRAAYAQAQAQRLDVIAEEILDITDNTELGEIVTDGPKGVETKRADMLGHRTLKVDARKWLLSKLMPHRFGERVEHTGAGGGPVQVEHSLSAKMLDNLAALRLRLPAAPVAVAHVIDVTPSRGNAKA